MNIRSVLLQILLGFLFISLSAGVLRSEIDGFSGITLSVPDTVQGERGSSIRFNITAEIPDGWHVNSNPASDGLIPTRVKLDNTEVLVLNTVEYPNGKSYEFSFSSTAISVYSDQVSFPVNARISNSVTNGKHEARIALHYQACSDKRCLPPRPVTQTLTVNVTDSGESFFGFIGSMDDWFSMEWMSSKQKIMNQFQNSGYLAQVLLIFLLGLGLNLTPCVYPMIPITVGYFGDKDRQTLSSRFVDGVFFILGMALIYSMLGALAGLTGAVLGELLRQPLMLGGLALLMVGLSGSMFGFYSLTLPDGLKGRSREVAKALGTFGMGMTMGVAAAPCVAPATVALLAYVGKIGSFAIGAGLFFVLSLGLGLPYLFLAVFSSSLASMPDSGPWMEWVKKLFGFFVLGAALYFLWPLLSQSTFAYLVITWLVVSGIVLGITHRPSRLVPMIARVLLLGLVVGSGVLWANNNLLHAKSGVEWTQGTKFFKNKNSIEGPAFVYVSAEWCVPCKEMKIKTFPNSTVQQNINQVKSIKIDLTERPPEHVNQWLLKHDIFGVPTMMFFDATGTEVQSIRAEGFVGSKDLIQRLKRIRKSSASQRNHL